MHMDRYLCRHRRTGNAARQLVAGHRPGRASPPVALFRTSLFDNPASQVYRYNTSLTQIGLSGVYNQQQEAVVMQQGRGNRFAAFDADSYVKRNGNTVWGLSGVSGRTHHAYGVE